MQSDMRIAFFDIEICAIEELLIIIIIIIIIIKTIQYNSFLPCVRVSNQTVVKCCTGLSIDLLLKIKQSLNFDVELYEVEDFQWGNKVGRSLYSTSKYYATCPTEEDEINVPMALSVFRDGMCPTGKRWSVLM